MQKLLCDCSNIYFDINSIFFIQSPKILIVRTEKYKFYIIKLSKFK
jgi:hypothetical protein